MPSETPKAGWAAALPRHDTKAELSRLVDSDRGHDEAENAYYEQAADPLADQHDRARRRFRGSYFRRLRRLQDRSRGEGPTAR